MKNRGVELRLYLLASLLCFIPALCLPCTEECGTNFNAAIILPAQQACGGPSGPPGIAVLFLGLLGPLTLATKQGSFFAYLQNASAYANIGLIIAMRLMFLGRRPLFALTAPMMILALSARAIYVTNNIDVDTFSRAGGPGYYLWTASIFICMLASVHPVLMRLIKKLRRLVT